MGRNGTKWFWDGLGVLAGCAGWSELNGCEQLLKWVWKDAAGWLDLLTCMVRTWVG